MPVSLSLFFVSNSYKPYSGGVVQSIDAIRTELLNQGHQVYLCTFDFGESHANDDPLIIRIPHVLRFAYKKNRMVIPWQPYHEIKKAIDKAQPDIIHAHHPFLLGTLAQKYAVQENIPFLFTYHTQYNQYTHYIPLPSAITKPIIDHTVKTFCDNTTVVIFPTQSIANQTTMKQYDVVPSPIRPFFFNAPEKKTTGSPFKLITVSRFAQEKNLTFLLDVIAQLPPDQFHYTLIGYGDYEQYLKWYAYEKCKLSKKQITFIIKPSEDGLLNHYSQANLFLFSSRTETQGLVLAEAMACGLPVIALNAPGACDIITHSKNGYLVHSEKEMVHYIKQLKNSTKEMRTMQKNARDKAAEYEPKRIAKKLIDLYWELI